MNKATILKIVNKEAGLDIKNKTRKREFSEARFIYFDLCRDFASDGKSLSVIGRTVKKDHATVLHGLKYCKTQREIKNKEFIFKYNNIRDIVDKKNKNQRRYQNTDDIIDRLEYIEGQMKLLLDVNKDLRKDKRRLEKQVSNLKSGYGYKTY